MSCEMSCEMYKFRDVVTREHHLTIKDLKNLNPGDELDVLIWDGNYEEYWIWDNAESEKPYDPREFYKSNRCKITYLHNLKWNIDIPNVGVIEHPIHLNLKPFIKETFCTWDSIEDDGKIHITSEYLPRGMDGIPKEWKAKHINWTDFPEETRIGWRGPIMLWEKLDSMPKVHYKQGFYGNSDEE